VIGGTRSGKTYLMRQIIFEREHPKGVVQGEVINSRLVPRAEIEAPDDRSGG
jgi:hypothetical protein